MPRICVFLVAGACVLMATGAHADTVYLKDGRTIWGKDVLEEGDSIVVVRPGGDLRLPKAQVDRIDRLRSTLPPFYSPPAGAAVVPPAGGPGVAAAPGQAGSPAGPAAPSATTGSAPPTVMPPAAPPVASPPGPAPTQLPAPPPPPAPGR